MLLHCRRGIHYLVGVWNIVKMHISSRSQTPYRWANNNFTNPARYYNLEFSDILISYSSNYIHDIIYTQSLL